MAQLTIDCRYWQAAGIGRVISHIVPRLIGLLPAHHFNLLGAPELLQPVVDAHENRVRVVAAEAPMYSLKAQWLLPRVIPKNTDLYWHPHYDIPYFYPRNMLVTVHDCGHLSWPDFQQSPLKSAYAKTLYRRVAKHALAVATDSDFSRDELLHYTDIAPEKVQTIYCGVEKDWFTLKKTSQKHEMPYFLFIGNLKPHKNIKNLLKAFEQVQGQIPHQMVIVGRREGFITGDDTVRAYAERLGDRVVFTGFISDDELKQTLADADFLAMPSLYEGFGLPPLEAMAACVPVLCSDAASLPEVGGDAVLYCDARDVADLSAKLLQIATDDALKAELVTKGKAQAKIFSWDKAAKEYAAVMEKLLLRDEH